MKCPVLPITGGRLIAGVRSAQVEHGRAVRRNSLPTMVFKRIHRHVPDHLKDIPPAFA